MLNIPGLLAFAAILASGMARADCGLPDDVDLARLSPAPPAYAAVALSTSRQVLPDPEIRPQVLIRATVAFSDIGGSQVLLAYRNDRGWKIASAGLGIPGRFAVPARTFPLSKEKSAELEGLVSGACLWRFPPYLPHSLPLKNGRDSGCLDGSDHVIEIRSGRRRWIGVQECQLQGKPREIFALLYRATMP